MLLLLLLLPKRGNELEREGDTTTITSINSYRVDDEKLRRQRRIYRKKNKAIFPIYKNNLKASATEKNEGERERKILEREREKEKKKANVNNDFL